MVAPDMKALAELEWLATGRPRPLSVWEREQNAPAFSGLVAEIDQQPVGYLCYMVAGDELSINHLAVTPTHRRRGIARSLLCQLLSWWCGRGVFLEVRQANQAAQSLYLGLGFELVGVRSGYYRDPTDNALLFRFDGPKKLSDPAIPKR